MSHFTSSYRLQGYLTLWTLTLISCREADPHDPHLSDYFAELPVVSLYGNPVEIVETDEVYFTQMWEMTYAEGMLIIRDKDPNHYFKIFHLHSGKIAKLGKIGDGPNELQTDHTRVAVDGANRLVYLSNYPHYYAYRVDSLKNNSNTNPLHRIKINPQEDNLIESTVSGGYVIGAMFTRRFGLHRLNDDHFSSLGEYEQGTFMSNQAAFYAHPFDKKAVMLARSSEAFAILDWTMPKATLP
ncbi:hypothetical protein [Negadavirga shengliensis]|uniref:6-bladed beta-propeller protein n=1 Tax=Negadavirga shengliensis TaxID=1389218 RepID=A0ABV9SY30_9BACT